MDGLQFLLDIGVFLFRILKVYGVFLWRCLVGHGRKIVSGEVVVITGAGHGMGREVAIRLGGIGAKLALLDIGKVRVDFILSKLVFSIGPGICLYILRCVGRPGSDLDEGLNGQGRGSFGLCILRISLLPSSVW
jgi:all-trans-retinol dehydrogenase (NAD+)